MRHSAVGDRPEPAVAGRPSGRRRWLVVTAVMLFAVGSLLLLVATNAGEGRDPTGQPESAADLGHIHGIGVNPDGRVYVGTHRGVFQLSEGQLPVLVSDGSRTSWVSPWSGRTTSSQVDTPVMSHRRPSV